MDISPHVREIITVLNTYADGALRESETLGRMLQHAADSGKHEALGELAFSAKFLTRVRGTAARQGADTELQGKLEEELSHAVHTFHAQVKAFVSGGDDAFARDIETGFLAIEEGALRRLVDLAGDFTWLKNWELEMTQPRGGGDAED